MTRKKRYAPIVLKDLRGVRRRPPAWWGKDCPQCGKPELVDADSTVGGKRAVTSFCINARCPKVSKTKVLSARN
jgi:hypothetical protein